MDRPDERKDRNDADEVTTRDGDILGLGGAEVPKEPGDPTASNDPEAVRHRRERALGAEQEPRVERDDPYKQTKGVTGIDMGAGGRGTDIEPD